MVASDALPVTPIRSVPDEERRRQLREAARDDGDGVGSESSSAVTREVVSDRRRNADGADAGGTGSGSSSAASDPVTTPLAGQSTGDNSGFVAQSIYQQNLGTGLHIEAWDSALTAYRRAEGTGTSTAGRGITV